MSLSSIRPAHAIASYLELELPASSLSQQAAFSYLPGLKLSTHDPGKPMNDHLNILIQGHTVINSPHDGKQGPTGPVCLRGSHLHAWSDDGGKSTCKYYLVADHLRAILTQK